MHWAKTVEPALPAELVEAARAFTDTALITICPFLRRGLGSHGRGLFDGDFWLSREEIAGWWTRCAARSRGWRWC